MVSGSEDEEREESYLGSSVRRSFSERASRSMLLLWRWLGLDVGAEGGGLVFRIVE